MNWDDKISKNVQAIKPSGIRKFFDIANQIPGVLSLSIGEPDFAAPDKVCEAMKASIDARQTSYTAKSNCGRKLQNYSMTAMALITIRSMKSW